MRSYRKRSAGFTLIELLLVVSILTLVMGVVFQQIISIQKANKTEETKLDLTQEGREFLDEFIRDTHQAGYPNASVFAVAMTDSDPSNAVGLVKFANDEVWLEADVDGDGHVESIDYKLQTASGSSSTMCPCKISRGWAPKTAAPMANTPSFTIELQDIINSGGGNGGSSGSAAYSIYGNSTINGSTAANDTLYTTYKAANVFTAYDANGNEVAPADYSTTAGKDALKKIKTIRLNINLMGRYPDQSGRRPVITLAASGKVGTN